MRSMVEGLFLPPENPSTALRAVPLPGKGRGGMRTPPSKPLNLPQNMVNKSFTSWRRIRVEALWLVAVPRGQRKRL